MGIPTGFDPGKAHIAAQWNVGTSMVCCRVEPKGQFVYCGVQGPTIHRLAIADGKNVPLTGGHDSWVFALATTPNGGTLYSGGGDGRIVAWEIGLETPHLLRKTEAHQGWVRALATSTDGRLLASGGNDHAVRIWETATGRRLHDLGGHQGDVYSLAFEPSGQTLLSGDLLGSIRRWDLATGREIGTFDASALHHHDGSQFVEFGGVRGLATSTDGSLIAAGGLHKASNPLGAVSEPLVLVFDSRTRKIVRTLTADGITSGVVWNLGFLADGSIVAASSGTSGGFLLFWKPGTDRSHHRLALPNPVRDMNLHPDGLRVATAHHDGYLRLTRLASGHH